MRFTDVQKTIDRVDARIAGGLAEVKHEVRDPRKELLETVRDLKGAAWRRARIQGSEEAG